MTQATDMLTPETIMQTLESNILTTRKYGVKRIGLFGSYARNEQSASSDIDILVEFHRDKKLFDNYMELKFFLEDLFGCKVDLVLANALKQDLRSDILGSVRYAAGS